MHSIVLIAVFIIQGLLNVTGQLTAFNGLISAVPNGVRLPVVHAKVNIRQRPGVNYNNNNIPVNIRITDKNNILGSNIKYRPAIYNNNYRNVNTGNFPDTQLIENAGFNSDQIRNPNIDDNSSTIIENPDEVIDLSENTENPIEKIETNENTVSEINQDDKNQEKNPQEDPEKDNMNSLKLPQTFNGNGPQVSQNNNNKAEGNKANHKEIEVDSKTKEIRKNGWVMLKKKRFFYQVKPVRPEGENTINGEIIYYLD